MSLYVCDEAYTYHVPNSAYHAAARPNSSYGQLDPSIEARSGSKSLGSNGDRIQEVVFHCTLASGEELLR